MSRGITAVLAAGAFVGLMAPAAHAQSVRGEIVDRASGGPVAGVVVLLLDAADRAVAQGFTDAGGGYRLTSPAPGVFRVRTLRIGYRPATSAEFTLAQGAEITLAPLQAGAPVTLDTIRVVGRNSCEVMSDTRATFAIWEQARTALTAARIAAGRGMSARVVTYQRTLRARNQEMLAHQAYERNGFTRRPFVAASPDSLRRLGYVITDPSGVRTFFAPDLDVLLSEQFLADHCFRIAPESDRQRIGIAFEPTRERRELAEIAGTIWVDRATSELRLLEFRYENVDYVLREAGAGGAVHFARLDNGAWVVSRWNIRMPIVERYVQSASGLGGRSRVEQHEVNQIREEGGLLALVSQGKDTLFAARPLTVSGEVRDSVTGRPVRGVRVALRNTAFSGTSDADGKFAIRGMLPGRYTVEVSTPELEALGAVESETVVATEHSEPVTLRMPNLARLVARLCPVDTTGVIAGTVLRPDSAGARNTRVVAEFASEGGARSVSDTTDLRGRYRACVPLETHLTVVAESDSGNSPPAAARVPRAQRVALVNLTLGRDAPRVAVLWGVVLSDVNGAPIPGVQVTLPAASRAAFTDERGAFRISNIPAGSHEVVVRRIGYQQVTQTVTLAAGQTLERRVLLSGVQQLDTLAVRARAELPDFEEHRRLGLGTFWTQEQLERQETRRMSEVLGQTLGLEVVRAGFGNVSWIASTRAGRTTANCWELEGATEVDRGKRCNCFVQVYLDGMPLFSGRTGDIVPDINRIPVTVIQAIEFYRGDIETPVKYRGFNSSCGVLVLHTRRTPRRP